MEEIHDLLHIQSREILKLYSITSAWLIKQLKISYLLSMVIKGTPCNIR